jgi:hypothetical protein
MNVALRYSTNIQRDVRRGYSFAEWGQTPYATRVECEQEWPHNEARYSRELGGWLPAHNGLCAAVIEYGETFDEALGYALQNLRTVEGMDESGATLWAFEAQQIGTDPYGWPLVRATGKPQEAK